MWLNVFSAKKEYVVRWNGIRCTKEDVELPVDVITGSSRFLAGQACAKAPVAEGLIGYECQGLDRYERRHDGFGNITVDRIEENSLLCGYVPIIITGSAAFSQRECVKVDPLAPVQGTILGTMCRGFDLYNVVADGVGGSSEVLVQPNSTSCGYVPPINLPIVSIVPNTGNNAFKNYFFNINAAQLNGRSITVRFKLTVSYKSRNQITSVLSDLINRIFIVDVLITPANNNTLFYVGDFIKQYYPEPPNELYVYFPNTYPTIIDLLDPDVLPLSGQYTTGTPSRIQKP